VPCSSGWPGAGELDQQKVDDAVDGRRRADLRPSEALAVSRRVNTSADPEDG